MDYFIKGSFRRSIFTSSSGYVVGIFKVKETNKEELLKYVNKTITFTGYFHELNEEDSYIFYGEENFHQKYGMQFQVTNYERVKPSDKESIILFLSSDLFKGVGEKLAESIVNTLGNNALKEIIADKSKLLLVPKMTSKKADYIYDVLSEYEESHNTVIKLGELGFNTKESLTIYNKYKTNTLNILEKNIFTIVEDINDFNFNKVDNAARILGYEKDDIRRVKAGIIYVMESILYQNGDTFLYKNDIYEETSKRLNIFLEDDKYLEDLIKEGKIVKYNDNYYLQDIWFAEENIVNTLYLLSNKKTHKYKNEDKIVSELEKNSNKIYNSEQKEAIIKALKSNFLIITGGPGTGKTTIINAIVEAYRMLNNLKYETLCSNVALLAPTGRASKRISESTSLPASTIHRFLKWNKDTGEFMVNETNKSKVQLVIIDEVSMIDINLFNNLLKGLSSNVQMILVGDYNQLPSVGPGQLLKDFIESDVINTVNLKKLYRQDENSYINTLAYEIKDNNLSENFLETKSDYTFLNCHNIKDNLKNLCTKILEKGYDYKRLQILAPMYKGENGIDNLNYELQEIFNPKDEEKREIKYGDVTFRENDKVLQLVNMPDDNVFNGDIGVIKYIKYANTSKSKKNEIYVDFDGNLVKYTPKDFPKIKHGFIISIHKSQGSEFEMVILPISKSYQRMLYKKLIYTAVTRAKRKLIIIGDPSAFVQSTLNDKEFLRNSNLKEKIMHKFID